MKHLSEPWFSLIKEGKKIVEGRLYKGDWKLLREGDIISFYNENDSFQVKVTDLSLYPSFLDFLEIEGIENCLPGYTMEEGLKVYYKIYSLEEEKKFGVIGIKFTCDVHL